ncbi:hypothetical protein PQJ75_01545 [Rhodoplanes sp. TEM]|uniref:Porin domain-containing protein n=1 Tax=Rhodoplanes tepidamans TaxID=200616 RepID=A0ABT5J9A0_RHOTP|nr:MULTISPECIES: hypothetical protein [Rhodoplanes]MDC7786225.1 hypothetical protein [Rhodoplanes tepidamans]MDC7982404.1 hypothetical protein [Rhodoplanes sp. TEM]MDQ0355024.1 hypothetical protein [Rhodoplanes tepidamans]
MVGPRIGIAVLLGLALPAAAGTSAAQPASPDFSVLAETPGGAGDRARPAEGASGPARKRRLHVEGFGVGWDVDDRLTVRGGLRPGGRTDESGASAGGASGVYLGIRRSLGRQ